MSGRVIQSTSAAPAAAPLPLPPLDFVPSDVVTEASRFRSSVAAAARLNRDAGTVKAGLAAALVGGGASAWLDAGMAILGEKTDDYSRQYALRRDAASAAYIGLTLAATKAEQARALALLSLSFEAQSLWRAALDSLKESLALAPIRRSRPIMTACANNTASAFSITESIRTRLAPRLHPFLGEFAQGAHGLLEICRGGGSTESGGLRDRPGALRRRPQARRTLRGDDPLPACLDGRREPARPASYTILCPRPPRRGALPEQRLCAARTGANGVPVVSVNTDKVMLDLIARRRPRPRPHHRRRLVQVPARILSSRPDRQRYRRQGLVRRDGREARPQHRGDHRLPRRRGAEDARARRLCARRAAQEQPSDTGGNRAPPNGFIVSELGLATFSGSTASTPSSARSRPPRQ